MSEPPAPDAGALLQAYDDQVRASELATGPDGVRSERDGPVLRIVGQYRGFVTTGRDLGMDGPELDALIARQRDFFALRNEAVEWKTRAHDTPTDIPERLAGAGFIPEPVETVMIGVAADLAGSGPGAPDGVAIRVATDDGDMHRIAALESAVWAEDLSWMADDLMGRLRADPDHLTVLVAEAAGTIVSAAWLVLLPGTEFAGLWGGSTLEGWRRRGIYHALVARRAELAAERGVRYLQVDASDDSRPILERLGFVAVTTTTPYVWKPPGRTTGDNPVSSGS